MTIEQAAETLGNLYFGALENEKALSVHLFGIKYAEKIRHISPRDIAVRAGLSRSYGTDIRKGINLAKYVRVMD